MSVLRAKVTDRGPSDRESCARGDLMRLPTSPAVLAQPENPPKLLIISDVRFMREGLADILRRNARAFRSVDIAADVSDAIVIMHTELPDLILIDAAMPEGLAVAAQLHQLAAQVCIIALAVVETERDVIAWAEAGASGYVPRTAALADLVGFLTNIMRGEQACSTRVAAGLLRWIASRPQEPAKTARTRPALTAREEEIIGLISSGLSNKEIARHLKICLATTKSHVHNVLAKLELQRRGQVSLWARDNPRI
jgi:two-component system, NarL family, nitrate/nitrite response regulator NarL